MAQAVLIPGKEKRVLGGHPWVFRSDIARMEGSFTPGDVVDVLSAKGHFLAKAYYNPASQIAPFLREQPVFPAPVCTGEHLFDSGRIPAVPLHPVLYSCRHTA